MKFLVKSLLLTALAGATLCLTGCFSLESAKPALSNEEHVIVRNYGWRLFYFLPIVCGNSDQDAFLPWTFFQNDVTMDKIQERFMYHAAKRGKKPSDLVYTNYDTVMWSIPLIDFPIPIPYLLCYNEIQLSGCIK